MPKTTNPYDDLAAMFLTGGDGSAKPINAPGHASTNAQGNGAPSLAVLDAPTKSPKDFASQPRAGIELLIVGHLPVRGNLWLTPYADLRSREIGATALVRLDGPEPSIQLLRAPQHTSALATRGTMVSAIDELSPFIDYWIIRAPSNARNESLAAAYRIADQITILTSADEPAVVAAYQIIKDMAQACGDAVERFPAIAVAVVGSDRATADMVVERLTRATTSFLGMDIQLAMCLPRIDAGVKSTRYIGFAEQVSPDYAQVIAALERARNSPAGPGATADDALTIAGRLYAERDDAQTRDVEHVLRTPRVSPPALAPPLAASLPNEEELSKWVSAARNRLASDPASATPRDPPAIDTGKPTAESQRPSSLPPIKLAPKPAMAIEAKQPPKDSEPAHDGKPVPLCAYISGLKLLPVRMPGHERIEIAADSAGRLHVVGHEQSLRELRLVEQWTRTHRELLIMACPQHPIDSLAAPHCHVFTDRPSSLADLHGADLSLHVLAPVVVNGSTGWYAAALNAVS